MPRIDRFSSIAISRPISHDQRQANHHERRVAQAHVEAFVAHDGSIVFQSDVAGRAKHVVAREAGDDAEDDRPAGQADRGR